MLNLNLVMIEQEINVSIVSRIEDKQEFKVKMVSRIKDKQEFKVSNVSRIKDDKTYADTLPAKAATIGQLKQMLGYKEKHFLFYDGKWLKDDKKKMMDCGIGDGAKIFLIKKIEVTIIKNEKPRSLTIEETIRFIDLMSLFVSDL